MLIRGGHDVISKRILFVGSLLAFMALVLPAAQADTLSQTKQHLAELQKEAAQTQKSIANSKAEASTLQTQIQKDQATLATVSRAINTNRTQLRQLSEKLAELSAQITQNETKLNADETKLKSVIRTQYEDGTVPYLDVIFNATSWSDFVSRLEMLSRISDAEHKLLVETQAVEKQLKSDQAAQTQSYAAVQEKSKQLESLQQQYQALEKQQQLSLAKTNVLIETQSKQRNLLESQITLTQSQIRAIEQATLEAEAKMNSQGYVSQARQGLKSVNTNALIQYAEQFMGLPYIWGGTTPNPGFDCSGFTQYVYAHFGIYMGRVTWDQFAEGVPVSRDQLQPGDLVFFSTYAQGASHVGIYIGNDEMIDSEDAGLIITPIFSNSYWAPRYIGARDFIKH